MNYQIKRFRFLVLLVILFSNAIFAAEKIVGFRAGYGSVNFRDVSSSKNWTAVEVSPLAFTGRNNYFELSFQFNRGKMSHIFGASFASANGFKYESGIRSIKRFDDWRTELLFYHEMKHYLFREVLPHLNVAIGPQVNFSRINSGRYFLPHTKLIFTENQLTAAFVLTLKYSLSKDWHFQAKFANGGLFGFERTKHNQYGWMPEKNSIHGWISALEVSSTYFFLSEIGFSAYYKRAGTVKIGKMFQCVAGENQFGVSLVYRLGDKR